MIAVVGSIMIDLVTYLDRMPTVGETVEAPQFNIGFGGKGANQAVAAARLGSQVGFVGMVGTDIFAELARNNLNDNGVDAELVGTAQGPTGVAPILVDPGGANRVIIVKGANAQLSAADIERARDKIAGSELIIAQLEIPLPTVYAAIDLGADLGIPVLLNPAPATAELDIDKIADCRFLVPNESELALLSGMPTESIEQVTAAGRSLLDRGLSEIVVTLGERGVLYLNGGADPLHIPGKQTTAADTTGAGDAFIGAFGHHWVREHDTAAAIRFGNSYAADSVTKRGTQTSYATAAEFDPK